MHTSFGQRTVRYLRNLANVHKLNLEMPAGSQGCSYYGLRLHHFRLASTLDFPGTNSGTWQALVEHVILSYVNVEGVYWKATVPQKTVRHTPTTQEWLLFYMYQDIAIA